MRKESKRAPERSEVLMKAKASLGSRAVTFRPRRDCQDCSPHIYVLSSVLSSPLLLSLEE